jgi:hypothetical protein
MSNNHIEKLISLILAIKPLLILKHGEYRSKYYHDLIAENIVNFLRHMLTDGVFY